MFGRARSFLVARSPGVSFAGLFLLSACAGSSPSPTGGGAAPTPAGAPMAGRSQAMPIGGCGAPGAGEEMRTSDVDEDGNPEVCKYYRTLDDPERPGQKKSTLSRMTLDVNGDGKTDIERSFAPSGLVTQESWDTDYDGRVDEVRTFEDGKIARAERDQDNDGRMEVVRFYDDGKLERKEVDTNGDGKPDRWEYFKRREVDRVGIDKDFDGKPDSWAKSPGSTPGT